MRSARPTGGTCLQPYPDANGQCAGWADQRPYPASLHDRRPALGPRRRWGAVRQHDPRRRLRWRGSAQRLRRARQLRLHDLARVGVHERGGQRELPPDAVRGAARAGRLGRPGAAPRRRWVPERVGTAWRDRTDRSGGARGAGPERGSDRQADRSTRIGGGGGGRLQRDSAEPDLPVRARPALRADRAPARGQDAAQATTLGELRDLYERQFAGRGRAGGAGQVV